MNDKHDITDIMQLVGKDPINNNIITMSNKLDFLLSSRFIALVIGAVIFYLRSKNLIGEPEMVLANTILGGFITIRTIDRAAEQQVKAAEATGKVTTVTMPSNVTKVSATTN